MSATVKPGNIVRVVKAFGAGKSTETYAFVLTVAALVPDLLGANGEPTLTVAFLKSDASASTLGSGNWNQAFDRVANVAHASHKDVVSGGRGIYWVDQLPDPGDAVALEDFAGAKLPAIEGNASSVFSREKAEDFFSQPAKTVPHAVEPVASAPAAASSEPAAAPASTTTETAAAGAPAEAAAPVAEPAATNAEVASAPAAAASSPTVATTEHAEANPA